MHPQFGFVGAVDSHGAYTQRNGKATNHGYCRAEFGSNVHWCTQAEIRRYVTPKTTSICVGVI